MTHFSHRASLSARSKLTSLLVGGLMLIVGTACDADRGSNKGDGQKPAVQGSAAQAPKETAKVSKRGSVEIASLAAFKALPKNMNKGSAPSPALIKLGYTLFFDPRLSKNQDISCNSCHGLDTYGVDNKAFSSGHQGQLGGRNAPSVYNAASHVAQFWDGRAADVEAQAKGPVLNPVEMALASAEQAEKVLRSIPGYEPLFAAAFPGNKKPITFDNFAVAVGAFERQLVTPAPFDAFLNGDEKALSAAAQQGFNTFVATGCTACHVGAGLGGHLYQKLGLVKAWPKNKDQGRFEVTKNDADKFFFKVPSLRNVAKTEPYFHDGSVADLKVAVSMMAEYQLGKTLSDKDAASIVTFLESLTGELPSAYIKAPTLPPSGKKTPKPDPS